MKEYIDKEKLYNLIAEKEEPVVHGKWIGTFPILGAGDFEFRCSLTIKN